MKHPKGRGRISFKPILTGKSVTVQCKYPGKNGDRPTITRNCLKVKNPNGPTWEKINLGVCPTGAPKKMRRKISEIKKVNIFCFLHKYQRNSESLIGNNIK